MTTRQVPLGRCPVQEAAGASKECRLSWKPLTIGQPAVGGHGSPGVGVALGELAFVARLRRDVALRGAVETWLAGADLVREGDAAPAWVEWEQRKHERLISAA